LTAFSVLHDPVALVKILVAMQFSLGEMLQLRSMHNLFAAFWSGLLFSADPAMVFPGRKSVRPCSSLLIFALVILFFCLPSLSRRR
jgi:hypothetical protein